MSNAKADLPSLRQLRYLVALADAGQYRRAARDLGISQPSLSLQITALEERLGLRLFERGRGGVMLTPAGRELCQRARGIIDDVTGLAALSDELREGLSGTLRLGSTPTIGPYILPAVLRDLHAGFPDLRLVLQDGPPRALLEGLQQGRHDLILTQLPVSAEGVIVSRLYREALVLAVARDHPMAARSGCAPRDLAGQDILTLSSEYALHAQVAQFCTETGAVLRRDYEGTSLDALRLMAAMNMGAALLPRLYTRSEVRGPEADVRLVEFTARGPWRSVGLVWRRGSGRLKSLERFRDAMSGYLGRAFSGVIVMDTG